jgi:hypothetical protein
MRKHASGMVERELQLYTERPGATVGEVGISLDNPHSLFDVPLEETLREFIDILEEYYEPERTYEQLRNMNGSPDRHPMFVFEQAINEILSLSGHESFAGLATENTSAAAHEVDSWKHLASLWLWQYLSAYNRSLHDCAPDALADFEQAVTELKQNDLVSERDVRDLVGYYLDSSASSYGTTG